MRALLLTTLILSGCDLPTFLLDRAEIYGAEHIEPLPEWEDHYREAEICFNAAGNFDAVRWHVVDSIIHDQRDGYVNSGLWRDGRIYIDRAFVGHRLTIVHESGHDVLGGDPKHSHPGWSECNLRGIL